MQDSTEIETPAEESTVLAEVLPGIAVVYGAIPPELKLDLIDFGLVPASDRKQISTFLATIGNTATIVGNAGHALTTMQGIYRIDAASQAVLAAGGRLAVKEGANLGGVFFGSKLIRQARFTLVKPVSAAQAAAAIGPALAMIALQTALGEVSGLVRDHMALTGQVLAKVRKEQWAELTGLVASIDRAVDQAREIGSVPASLWDSVASHEAALRKQRELYRLNVDDHVRAIQQATGARSRREYLEANAETIAFDANALLASVKAWIGHQALHAGRARTAGPDDEGEAQLVDVIARDTRAELDATLAGTTFLVDALRRELRIIVELPGRDSLPLAGMRKDAKAARETSARLLEAIEPLADALHPPVPPVEAPDVVCAPETLSLEPYLRILRWFLADGESVRAVGFAEPADGFDPLAAISGTFGKWTSSKDRGPVKTLVAVTDRRVVTAQSVALLEQGEIRDEFPVDLIRYVRVVTTPDKDDRRTIDVITRDENIRWVFHSDVDGRRVGAFAAVLAESMAIPDGERDALQSLHRPALTE